MGALRYTEAEDAIIRAHYGRVPLQELGRLVGRPWKAVAERVRRLGLQAPEMQCARCGTVFKPSLAGYQRYCSQKCSSAANYESNAKEHCRRSRVNEKRRRGAIPKTFANWAKADIRALWDEYQNGRKNLAEFAKARGYTRTLLSSLFRAAFPSEWAKRVEQRRRSASTWKRGASFEYRVLHYLQGLGYWVLRSPGSGGAADLVALRPGSALLVQCKLMRSYFNTKARADLRALAESAGAVGLLAYRDADAPHWAIRLEDMDGKRVHLAERRGQDAQAPAGLATSGCTASPG